MFKMKWPEGKERLGTHKLREAFEDRKGLSKASSSLRRSNKKEQEANRQRLRLWLHRMNTGVGVEV